MTIWVDADACPAAIREIICRAAKRCSMTTYFVANHHIALPKLPNISMLQVGSGFDVADQMIAERSQAGDLVITSDIPLAAELIAKKVEVISSRGQIFNADNVRARLNMRDFMETMRSSGVHTGGPAALSTGDKQSFANALDRYLARAPKSL